jgi:hypothetical protein
MSDSPIFSEIGRRRRIQVSIANCFANLPSTGLAFTAICHLNGIAQLKRFSEVC